MPTDKIKAGTGTVSDPIEVKGEWGSQCGLPIALATCPRCFFRAALADSSTMETESQRHKGICSNCHTFITIVTSGAKPPNAELAKLMR